MPRPIEPAKPCATANRLYPLWQYVTMASTEGTGVPWFLKSTYPVLFPTHEALTKPRAEFEALIRNDLARRHDINNSVSTPGPTKALTETGESFTEINPSTTADIREGLQTMDVDAPEPEPSVTTNVEGPTGHPFMEGLISYNDPESTPNLENNMLTENGDISHQSTTNPLVDLFSELEDVVTTPRLRDMLEVAWKHDPLSTLKIIFNARSIHLGKSSRLIFYHCAGWLAQNHPLTLVANLQWLSRPVIPKKAKKDEKEDDLVLVDDEKDESNPSRYDVKHGVAHGYWKDLLNILALAANGKLDGLSNPQDILNTENPGIVKGKSVPSRRRGAQVRRAIRGRGGFYSRGRGSSISRGRGGSIPRGRGGSYSRGSRGTSRGRPPWRRSVNDAPSEDEPQTTSEQVSNQEGSDHEEIHQDDASESEKAEDVPTGEPLPAWKEKQRQVRAQRHRAAVKAFNENHVYRALHLTVARLFAEQLEVDLTALRGEDPKAKRAISLCAKWAPSHDHFHDRHTLVISSIAEILYPRESFDGVLSPTDDRQTYLRHARERYRKETSALRKHLEVVERNVTAQTFENIKYDRVPSVAMNNYSKLFAEKDIGRFEKYIDRVAEGKAKISGATLLPSTLVHQASQPDIRVPRQNNTFAAALVQQKMQRLQAQVVDGQWKTLVQRMKDSGALSSAIAVCDVSGSMGGPTFKDGTCPMDSAIGLSLLVASTTAPPFGGAFITFSSNPEVQEIDLSKPFTEQIQQLSSSAWGMSTNFVSVFKDLILPMALKNKLKPEDMVKRIFVFSDMQFDSAERSSARYRDGNVAPERWSSSYQHIKGRYEDAGYEMPELVFWNLAGGRDGMAPKPVTTTDEGTSLVSGYSQGMLKVFLENGGFEEPEAEEEPDDDAIVVSKDEDGEVTAQPAPKKAKMDPLMTVKKAIGHTSYEMLKVMD
ncbi:hypothetical protein ACO1O0_002845 [Amphichorda felina]